MRAEPVRRSASGPHSRPGATVPGAGSDPAQRAIHLVGSLTLDAAEQLLSHPRGGRVRAILISHPSLVASGILNRGPLMKKLSTLTAFLAAAAGVFAQTAGTGTVFGAVTDPSGAVVPEA